MIGRVLLTRLHSRGLTLPPVQKLIGGTEDGTVKF